MNVRFDALRTKLGARIDVSHAGLDAKIDSGLAGLDAKIDSGLAGLDAKIESVLPELRAEIVHLRGETKLAIARTTYVILAGFAAAVTPSTSYCSPASAPSSPPDLAPPTSNRIDSGRVAGRHRLLALPESPATSHAC